MRLSPIFVEWLMGLPEGWVTEVPGLSRTDQLKCLGNGVVPQQLELALQLLLQAIAGNPAWGRTYTPTYNQNDLAEAVV